MELLTLFSRFEYAYYVSYTWLNIDIDEIHKSGMIKTLYHLNKILA